MTEKQTQQVLDHLNRFGSITSFEAIMQYRITRLAAVIFELKRLGYKIKTKMVYNGKKRWGVYSLDSNS